LSTKFTESVSSQVLETPLVQLLADAHSWVLTSLVRLMMDKGHTSLTGKDLVFFSHLDCGITPDDQRQKVISMTPMGEKIALDARASLAEIEGYLASTVGGASLKQLKATLAQNWVSMDTRCTDNSLGAKSAPK